MLLLESSQCNQFRMPISRVYKILSMENDRNYWKNKYGMTNDRHVSWRIEKNFLVLFLSRVKSDLVGIPFASEQTAKIVKDDNAEN